VGDGKFMWGEFLPWYETFTFGQHFKFKHNLNAYYQAALFKIKHPPIQESQTRIILEKREIA